MATLFRPSVSLGSGRNVRLSKLSNRKISTQPQSPALSQQRRCYSLTRQCSSQHSSRTQTQQHRQRPQSQCQRSFSSTRSSPREIGEAYILSAARTPVALFNGSFSTVPAPRLGSSAIKAAIERSHVDPSEVGHVYMGNVLSANIGQAPARQATIFTDLLTSSVEATTINKVCSSGLKAVAIGAQQIQLGLEKAVVAGGMENMSLAPYYLPRGTQMPPFGHIQAKDSLIGDGLWDVYNQIHMGSCAENTARKYNISREEQDAFAIESFRRANEAWENRRFDEEIVPVTVKNKKGDVEVKEDEGYKRLKLEKVPTLKPAFEKNGTVTAASSSSMNDGASALVLGNRDLAKQYGSESRVLAKIVSSADAAIDPIDFPTAPAKAIPIALERAGIKKEDVAVWEINEAFAAVVLAIAKEIGLEEAMGKVNPLGGGIPLGHPIGSSGSRILTTLLHQLKPGQFGVAGICNGGAGATAMVVQRVDAV